MNKNSKIYIAGHKGLVGSAIHRKLEKQGYNNLILKTREDFNLTNQQAVADFFAQDKPEYVFMAAAKVGGIMANSTYPADFIYENLAIQNNVLQSAFENNVKKLLFLGSSCIYPREALQPMKEEYFMTGPLEPTNIAYASAKVAGIIACQSYFKQHGSNFISVMPTNLYGPNDNFDLETSHVLPAFIHRFHKAKLENLPSVTVWGTGSAKREFLHVDDCADACLYLMLNYDEPEIVNIGTGEDKSIKELAEITKEIVGYEGKLEWDTSKPNGMPRKLLDVSKLHNLGWQHTIDLKQGIKDTYEWFKNNQ